MPSMTLVQTDVERYLGDTLITFAFSASTFIPNLIGAIAAPKDNPANLKECIEDVWKHELENSKKIYALVDKAMEEKDWATFNFMQWFVKEQIEEEALIDGLRDKFALASEGKADSGNFYSLDRDMQDASQEAEIPREKKL